MRGRAHPITVPPLTTEVSLPGGQNRLRQIILYVAMRCERAERFGLVKLNKIIWKADFSSFAARNLPITGRKYQKLKLGPAPKEMLPLLKEMERFGLITLDTVIFPNGKKEVRVHGIVPPNLDNFTQSDMRFVESAIVYYWYKTGTEASDESHGIAWRARKMKSLMPYELAYVSDDPISNEEKEDIMKVLRDRKSIAA